MIEDIESFSKRNILNYAVAVNLERSVPDLYDGLKPVHRRILWGAYQQPKGQFVKSARIVGDVIGKYHPHGDSSVYQAMVGMVNSEAPLIEGKGNWGTLVDEAAAMRYTNARLSKYGLSFFGSDYITKEVTDFVPNYDDKDVEPVTLPAQLPNVLLNTASGIGWGTTTNLPAFTVKSVVNVLQKLLLKEKLNARSLARLLKPSLPYGGRLVDSKRNKEQWLQLMSQPSARIEYEAALKVDSKRKQIVIDEWPPGLIPDKFVERVRALPECDSVYNSKGTLEFTITCKRAYNETQFEAFVKKVQKLTLRAVSYRMNVTSRTANIVDGVVGYETEFLSLGVGPLLVRWLRARVELEKRSLRHRIAKQQTSIAYTELLIYAVSIKDVIFKSLEAKDSVAYLVKHGKLTEEQAKQILDLRVRQLSKLDDIEMRKRLKQQKQELKQLRGWLKRPRAKIAEDLKSFV